MNKKTFTQKEIETLNANDYTAFVNERTIRFTLAFKLFAVDEFRAGTKSTRIFEKAGYDINILGTTRVYAVIKRIKKEMNSPQGLREPNGQTKKRKAEQFAKEQLAKKETSDALDALQNKVVQLEAEMDFLKDLMATRVAESRRKT